MQVNAPPRVFVVDKDAHVRRLLESILTDAGYEPVMLLDGYHALDQARLGPPAIVLTEIMIPRLDGLALCRLLKNDAATCSTKVLVLSMLGAEERAHQSGADAFMKKPIERNALIAQLQALSPVLPTEGTE